ncbi:hypothetical protein [Methylobacterium sp. GC_Met_2]|uniref:hypothetical protein n=1 Tax=Methylobacterium sp. GC_Met_2 TaxID=2937376 RepID=UPI00226B4159|nr:hypothetical protein [Methylobacterium sp. GC_Met_2]
MPSPSLVHAARHAPHARAEIFRMARFMVEQKNGPEGACTIVHLFQKGWTEAEVHAYRDPARALIRGLPLTGDPPGRREAEAAAEVAREIRFARAAEPYLAGRAWAPPVVTEASTPEAAS